MKQISTAQARILAYSDPSELRREERYCQGDWIKENAYHIAEIETKYLPKTFYGGWPKGWKHAMKIEAKARAEKNILDQFITRECLLLDGVIWLSNLSLIERLLPLNSSLDCPAEK